MKYHKKILDNGLTVILAPLANIPLVSAGFFVLVGSRNETEKNGGIAHFLEHMMFKGTKTRTYSQLAEELDSLGGIYNAVTTPQHTYYYSTCHFTQVKKLLDIILDIYINPRFEKKEIVKERKVIFEEMHMRNDSPVTKMYNIVFNKFFRDTSLSRPIIGTHHSLNSLNKSDFVNFRDAYYTPNNTIFVVTGNFNHKIIFTMIQKVLGKIQPKVSKLEKINYEPEKETIFKNLDSQTLPHFQVTRNKALKQVYVMIVFPIWDLFNKQEHAINLLSSILSDGFSSRLFSALRANKGITYNVSSYPLVYVDVGLFIIDYIVVPEQLAQSIRIVLRELRKLKRKPVTSQELKKVKISARNTTQFSLIKPLDYLVYYGLTFLYDRNAEPNPDKTIAKINRITPTKLQQLAKKIFIKEKLNIFIYGGVGTVKIDKLTL